MYNTCHYYYVIGIFYLIRSDISSDIKIDPDIVEADKIYKSGPNLNIPVSDEYIADVPNTIEE